LTACLRARLTEPRPKGVSMGLRPTHGNEKHARPIFGGEQQANLGVFFNGVVMGPQPSQPSLVSCPNGS